MEFIRRVKGNQLNKFIILNDDKIHEVVVGSNGEGIPIQVGQFLLGIRYPRKNCVSTTS